MSLSVMLRNNVMKSAANGTLAAFHLRQNIILRLSSQGHGDSLNLIRNRNNEQDDDFGTTGFGSTGFSNTSNTGFGGGGMNTLRLASEVAVCGRLWQCRVEMWLTTTFHRLALGGNDGWFSNPGFGGVTPRARAMTVVVLAIQAWWWHSRATAMTVVVLAIHDSVGVTPRANGSDGGGFGNPGLVFRSEYRRRQRKHLLYWLRGHADSTLRSGSSGGGFGSAFTRRTSGAASSLSTGNVPAATELAAMTYICSDCHGKLRSCQDSYSLPGMWLQNTL
uniref:Uncharacterized protein n=1 Tax=Ditylenchus dipsaci TaxID=166011 RepID=A0A915E2Y7_9BILA